MRCIKPAPEEVSISLEEQVLCFQGGHYQISSSKFGIGSVEGSNKTPLGTFQVSELYGAGMPLYTIFKGRRPVGTWDSSDALLEEDMILTRIIRLSGLEVGNHNTYARYIYLHGTNAEEQIGTPSSIGCIRLQNNDMISLYNRITLGTVVRIQP